MRAATIILTSLLASASVLAQPADATASAASATPADDVSSHDRNNQRIERIRIEDEGSRVDELRVGGETKQITVQPKVGNLPAYEVQPANAGRDGHIQGQDGTNGRRTWKALQF